MPTYHTDGLLALAIENEFNKQVKHIYSQSYPLLDAIKSRKTKFNQGYVVQGEKILTYLMADMNNNHTTKSTGFASQATAVTPAVYSSTGQQGSLVAQWEWAQQEAYLFITPEEKNIAKTTQRYDFIAARVQGTINKFKDVTSTQLAGSSGSSRSTVQGLVHLIATGNTVGGLAQGTFTDWQGLVTTSVGAVTLDHLDTHMDQIAIKGRGEVDLLLLSMQSSNNLFGKIRSQIAPAQLVTAPPDGMNINYGTRGFQYAGAYCVMDGRIPSGTIMGLSTDTFYWAGGQPKQLETNRVQGTGVDEYGWVMFSCLACDDIGRNFRLTGCN